MATARDSCVVPSGPLAEMLHRFVTDWNRDRPRASGQFDHAQTRHEGPVSAVHWLAAESGVPESTIQNIVAEAGPRYHYVELRTADSLVAAIGRPDVFYDGNPPTLQVQGNAKAPLTIARVPSRTDRFTYSARIDFAGRTVGRVERRRGGRDYRAFVGRSLVAAAPTMGQLRSELSQRARDVCCGGSLTGSLS